MLKATLLKFIKLYQLFSVFGLPRCRFQPTCSYYMYEAVEKYGFLKGFYLGLMRLIRCHPFAKGGFDPVP